MLHSVHFPVFLQWHSAAYVHSLQECLQSPYFSPDFYPMSSFPPRTKSATSGPVGSIHISALNLTGRFALCSNNSKSKKKIAISTCVHLVQWWGHNTCTQLVWVFHNMCWRGRKKNTKRGNWQKSVRPGINNPAPQMPSIVPCLDKVSKSGWKMQAPFLSVWNYYPFVLSQALLSSTSCVCV